MSATKKSKRPAPEFTPMTPAERDAFERRLVLSGKVDALRRECLAAGTALQVEALVLEALRVTEEFGDAESRAELGKLAQTIINRHWKPKKVDEADAVARPSSRLSRPETVRLLRDQLAALAEQDIIGSILATFFPVAGGGDARAALRARARAYQNHEEVEPVVAVLRAWGADGATLKSAQNTIERDRKRRPKKK